jgi:serine/threonine protein kinase
MPEIGQTLSHFKIVEKIGEGGMGEVYLADDTALDRKVALKFLPEAFTSDPERMARFEREAKLLASLNHPNIAGIYGLEQADGNRFLVLEYVEGETLQARLSKGALPLEDALELCRQIAEGLEAAHEKGVIHRDLKPANVMITADEKVKILDFGLAKALADDTGSIDSSQSPTLTDAMTRPGVILGTAAYMSPEQAKGKSVDKRADIWAFGCILYECLTHKRAFEGETVPETLAAILRGEPDWDILPDSTPQNIRFVLRRCLEKERKRRLRDAADVQIEIEEVRDIEAIQTTTSIKQSRMAGIWAVIATILVIVLAAPAFLYFREQGSEEVIRLQIPVPPMPNDYNMAISPDGRSIAYVAQSTGSETMLFIRKIESINPWKLNGTEDAAFPFWSPDSRSIAFFAKGRLKRVDVSGGSPRDICAAPAIWGGAWNKDGIIFFSDGMGPLRQVPEESGEPQEVTKLDESQNETAHVYPHFLPDGRHYFYTVLYPQGSDNGIYIGSLDSKEKTLIKAVHSMAAYAEPGYLLFQRGRTLLAQPFDFKGLKLKNEEPVSIADNLILDKWSLGCFSVSQNHRIIYRSTEEQGQSQFVWLDRAGKLIGIAGEMETSPAHFELSPDGEQIAMRQHDPVTTNVDIYLMDLRRNLQTPFTNDPYVNGNPIWSPEGDRIAFGSYRKGNQEDILEKKVGSVGEEIFLLDSPSHEYPQAWSNSGRYIAYAKGTGSETDTYILPLFGEKTPFEIYPSPGDQWNPQFSPNDDWLAYQSNESGKSEVYVISFPSGDWRIPVSNNGGTQPRWRKDGKELYYLAPDGKLMAVDIQGNTRIDPGVPHELFDAGMSIPGSTQYDVTPDGQRFLFLKPYAEANPTPITVTLNWTKLLEK